MQVVAILNFNPLHVGCLGPNHVWGQSSIRHTSVKAMLLKSGARFIATLHVHVHFPMLALSCLMTSLSLPVMPLT